MLGPTKYPAFWKHCRLTLEALYQADLDVYELPPETISSAGVIICNSFAVKR